MERVRRGGDGVAGGGAGHRGAAQLRQSSAGRGASASRWRDVDHHTGVPKGSVSEDNKRCAEISSSDG